MKANHDKCHILLNTQERLNIQIANFTAKFSKAKKLLGIILDKNLKFDMHVESICQKANKKLNALARIANYMELPKRRILLKAFFKSQFNYCPAIWMFPSRTLNNKINRLHERCLRIIYDDKLSNFDERLHKDNSASIHRNNTHALAIEMHKVVNGTSPEIMNKVFKQRNNFHYDLRHTSQFFVNAIHSVYKVLTTEIYKIMQKISLPLLSEVFVPRQCNYEFHGNNFLERRRVKSVR